MYFTKSKMESLISTVDTWTYFLFYIFYRLEQWFLTFFVPWTPKIQKISTDPQSVNKCHWWTPES